MPQLFLAIDDHAIPLRQRLCLTITPPKVRAEPVLTPSPRDSLAPDNCAAMFYGTVLHDQGRYRMWYHACHWGMNPDWPPSHARQFELYKDPMIMGPVCYAESDDGLHWDRPALKQVMFKGTRENNVIDLPHPVTGGVLVVKDDSDADSGRRYKMVYQFFPRYCNPPLPQDGNMTSIALAVSPDGLAWTPTAVPYASQFIEPAGYWLHMGKHIVGYQAGDGWGAHFSEGGHASGRQGLSRWSADFNHWIDGVVESFIVPEPADPKARGHTGDYIHNHLGVTATSMGNVCVGLWGKWHNKPAFHDISCDLGLLVSCDGLHFHEPVPGHTWLKSTDSSVTASPTAPLLHTNLCQSSGLINVGDETRIYHGRWRNTGFEKLNEYYGEIALATLPRDRWGSLGLFPNAKQGCAWTQPFTWTDCRIHINAQHAQGLTVEVCTEDCYVIENFKMSIQGDHGLSLPLVVQSAGADQLKGQQVRLKISFQRVGEISPALFAVNID